MLRLVTSDWVRGSHLGCAVPLLLGVRGLESPGVIIIITIIIIIIIITVLTAAGDIVDGHLGPARLVPVHRGHHVLAADVGLHRGKYLLAAVKIFASDLVVREGEEAVVVQQHVDQVGELALVARGEEAVTDHVDNLHMLRSSVLSREKHWHSLYHVY